MPAKKEVAIIGAGPAGLITGSILKKAGLTITLFEQRECLGGSWAIQPLSRVVDIREGLSGIYSPTYPSLRCNIPKLSMALPGFPFPENYPYYPRHDEVLTHLQNFAKHNRLLPLIRFGCRFLSLEPVSVNSSASNRWKVSTSKGEGEFDAVVFCNGRYFYPMLPELEPLLPFSGRLEHSFSYRGPEAYRNKRVVIMGTGPSGEDLSREISHCAKRVYLCAHPGSRQLHKPVWEPYGAHNNLTRHRELKACEGHTVTLANNEKLNDIDVLILCTGYQPDPVLKNAMPGIRLSGNKNCLSPLYLNLFHPQYPELSVTGMDLASAPFILYHYQAEAIAGYLNGTIKLPSAKRRQFAAEQLELRTSGKIDFSLRRENSLKQLEKLAAMAGIKSRVKEVKQVLAYTKKQRLAYPDDYRDLPWDLN